MIMKTDCETDGALHSTSNEQQQDERSTQHCQGGAGKLCSMLQNMNSSDSLLQNLGYEHHEHDGTSVSLKFAVNQMCRAFLSVTKCLH